MNALTACKVCHCELLSIVDKNQKLEEFIQ